MGLHVQVSEWTKNQSISSNWVTVWNSGDISSFKAKFYNAIWQISSNNIRVKITYNEDTCLNLDLSELSNSYKLSSPQLPGANFILTEHQFGVWVFNPPEHFFINIGSSMKVEMMATVEGKTYNLDRGMSTWGQP